VKIYDINIFYGKRNILKTDMIDFPEGNLTVITGESGSGKSSLLSCICLDLHCAPGYLTYNEKKLEMNRQSQQKIKRELFTYIEQNKRFIEELSCYDNICLAAKTSGAKLSKERLQWIIDTLDICFELSRFPNSLSGGEKVKLALAIAIARDTPYIFLDEITASLDNEEEMKIVRMLKKLAHDYGKTIICTSHSAQLADIADIRYEIGNKEVKETYRLQKDTVRSSSEEKREQPHLLTKFNFKRKKRHMLELVIRSTAFIFICLLMCMGYIYGQQYEKAIARITNFGVANELFLTNVTFEDKENSLIYLPSDYLGFDSQQHLEIQDYLRDKAAFYPFYNFNISDSDPQTSLAIVQGSQTIFDEKLGNNQRVYIYPFYQEQNYDDLCISLNKNSDGVYISYLFAIAFNITDVKDLYLNLSIAVPFHSYETTLIVNGSKQPAQKNEYKYMNIAVPVRGILSTYKNEIFGSTNIYMDKDQMNQLLEQAADTNTSFKPSTYIMFLEEKTERDLVKQDLEQLDDNYRVEGINDYLSDGVYLEQMTQEKIVFKFVLISVCLFAILTYMYSLVYSKKEYQYYRMLGLYGVEKSKILGVFYNYVLIELCMQFCIASLLCYWLVPKLIEKGILLSTFTISLPLSILFILLFFYAIIVNLDLLRKIIKNDKY